MGGRYRVTAQIVVTFITYPDNSVVIHSVPTFELDGDTLGIVNEDHAAQIAKTIVCSPCLCLDNVVVNVTAIKI